MKHGVRTPIQIPIKIMTSALDSATPIIRLPKRKQYFGDQTTFSCYDLDLLIFNACNTSGVMRSNSVGLPNLSEI